MLQAAVFLDRDGTLIPDVHYLSDPQQVQLLPGVAEAICHLKALGMWVVVVTNQSGVARGYFPESQVYAVHQRLSELLSQSGARIDAYYFCPHHEDEGIGSYRIRCACRKPAPGLLYKAASQLPIDLTRSWMIGDKISDAQAGAAAGCRTILVRTGPGSELPPTLPTDELRLAAIVDDLAHAVEIIRAAQKAAPAGY
ncbi:MAG: HAD family hydrolase [Gemmataceae bacterium]|nr:HAD family hydrolase [Gemmata sp.]MDW8196055.1 HAD family hydrolase [Gemmataceae bacterium]